MCTGKFQFRKPGAVEQNQRTEKFGRPPPVFFRTSILPYDQQGAQETSKRETAEIQGGFCFEGTEVILQPLNVVLLGTASTSEESINPPTPT